MALLPPRYLFLAESRFCYRRRPSSPPKSMTMYAALVRNNMMKRHASSQSAGPFINASVTNHLMLVSDLDLTLVDHNDSSHSALNNFNCLWQAEYAHNSHLVYSTGRSMQRYLELKRDAPLLTPAVLILSVGTEIRLGPSFEIDKEWEKVLDEGWNRQIIVEEVLKLPELRFQEEPDQGSHKVSFKVDKVNAVDIQRRLSARLKERGLNVRLLYSSGIDLDVLPYKAGKGKALAYVLQKLSDEGVQKGNILVCGDSGNDIDLFLVDDACGVIVSNAQSELLEWYKSNKRTGLLYASKRCAGAIVEALKHFGFGPHTSPFDTMNQDYVPRRIPNESHSATFPGSINKEVVEFNVFLQKWLQGEVPNSMECFQRLLGVISDGARMIHHTGVESSIIESLGEIRQKHGCKKGLEVISWFDVIRQQELADGVYLVTWQSWSKAAGERRGFSSSAILIAKNGTSNGLKWHHLHETCQEAT